MYVPQSVRRGDVDAAMLDAVLLYSSWMCWVRRGLRVGVGAECWACMMHGACAVSSCGGCCTVVCVHVVVYIRDRYYRSMYTSQDSLMPHCEPVSLCGGCVVGVCGEGSSDMVGYSGAGWRGWRRGEGESKVVSGYAVADGEDICEYEGARDHRRQKFAEATLRAAVQLTLTLAATRRMTMGLPQDQISTAITIKSGMSCSSILQWFTRLESEPACCLHATFHLTHLLCPLLYRPQATRA